MNPVPVAHRAIHADALVVGAMPLSPAVALRCLHRDAVVIADDVGERLEPERAGVVFVGRATSRAGCSSTVSTTRGSLPKVSRVHSSAICCERQIRIPGEPAEAVEIGLRQVIAEPVGVRPTFDTPTKPPVGRWNVLPDDERLDRRRRRPPTRMSKSSASFHIGTRNTVWRCLPHVLLRDLQLDRLVRLLERAEQRRGRLAHLKIDRAVLDLNDRRCRRTVPSSGWKLS